MRHLIIGCLTRRSHTANIISTSAPTAEYEDIETCVKMLKEGEVRIVWKTTCKWRNTDYIVERKDVKPDNISTDDEWKTMPLKRGDNVKVKYGNRWYKAQVEEIGENSRKDVVEVSSGVVPEVDHYELFKTGQTKRELDWEKNRENAQKTKKQKKDDAKIKPPIVCANDVPDHTTDRMKSGKKVPQAVEEQPIVASYIAKMTVEINENIKSYFGKIEQNQRNFLEYVQVSIETQKKAIDEMNAKVEQHFQRIEQRLESDELSFNDPLLNSTVDDETIQSENVDGGLKELSTIDMESLRRLMEIPTTATPSTDVAFRQSAVCLETSTQPAASLSANQTTFNPRAISEELIKKFVTPTKDIKRISVLMKKSTEPHRCALKLLPFFFTQEELQRSNTEGNYDKEQLDPVRQKSLRVLLFNRFPMLKEEEEKMWKTVKSHINTRCRSLKFHEKKNVK